jgi:hypothetical protein
LAPAAMFGLGWKQMFSPRSQTLARPFTSVLYSEEDKGIQRTNLFPTQAGKREQ